MTEIPERLRVAGIRFVLIQRGTKKPYQEGWQNKNIQFDSPELIAHLSKGGSYGVLGGGEKCILILDFDNENLQKELCPKLPDTFTVKTGSGMLHKYFISDSSASFKILDEDMRTLADVQGEGKQVIGAGSVHPNGNTYEVVDDRELAFIPYGELKALLIPYDNKSKIKPIEEIPIAPPDYKNNDFIDTVKSRVSMQDVLGLCGVNTSLNPTSCPFHDSKGGKCLGFNNVTAHCFHCDGRWNIFSLVKQYKNYSFVEALEFLADNFGLNDELEKSRERYRQKLREESVNEKRDIKLRYYSMIGKREKDWNNATELLVNYLKKYNHIYTTKVDEKSEMWIYKDGIYVPQGKSEIAEQLRDLLEEAYNTFVSNYVLRKLETSTFISLNEFFKIRHKNEIIVQNGILNIWTRELTPFTHEKIFFNKLPVTYNPQADCPKINKFLGDVLREDEDKKVFYELCGFALLKEYKFEKSFMLVGDGRNGKGKSIELIKRMVGIENCVSLPLSHLIPESFQISDLFGKHLNLAGDIGNSDLKDTSMFKSLTGRDMVTSKRKFLPSLSFENYAKFVFACNELPMVYDSSRGFWDRWILLEFPYTFVNQDEYENAKDKSKLKIKDEDIINKISTPEELSGLLNAALNGLAKITATGKFSATKGCEEVKDIWMRGANSFMAFCMDNVEEQYDSRIGKKEMRKKYASYCKKYRLRSKNDFIIKKVLQEEFGAGEEESRTFEIYDRFWTGIKWKDKV